MTGVIIIRRCGQRNIIRVNDFSLENHIFLRGQTEVVGQFTIAETIVQLVVPVGNSLGQNNGPLCRDGFNEYNKGTAPRRI